MKGNMIRFSIIRSGKICNLVRVAVAVTLLMPLGCSDSAEDASREAPFRLPETLRITVRNESDSVQYLDNVYSWMRSATASVGTFDGGSAEPPSDLALYTNQPSCEGIVSGEWACGQHGDSGALALAIAPGAEHSEEWDAQVWRRSSLEGDPDCTCMEREPAPVGDYLVSFGVSPSVACEGESCLCEPGDSSCVVWGVLSNPEQLERPVTWPEDDEVLLVLE